MTKFSNFYRNPNLALKDFKASSSDFFRNVKRFPAKRWLFLKFLVVGKSKRILELFDILELFEVINFFFCYKESKI